MLNNKYFYFITEHDLNFFLKHLLSKVFNYPINLKVKHKIQTIFLEKKTKNEFEIINFKTD